MKSMLFGVATGATSGLIAVLTSAVLTAAAADGISGVFTTWWTYLLIFALSVGFLLLQNALQAGRLVAAQPADPGLSPWRNVLGAPVGRRTARRSYHGAVGLARRWSCEVRRPAVFCRGRMEMRIDVEAELRMGCVCSGSERARAARAEMEARYRWANPDDCDVLVALGGDGFLLHVMHSHLRLERPIFGMNRGTVGFLLNQFRPDGLLERIAAATRIDVHPLAVRAVATGGDVVNALAFNEVTVTRDSAQSVNIRVCIDGVERLGNFVGDGIIIATAAGSTAYNFSAHGPILPLGSRLLALTPVSPFRPRRWRGALLPHTAQIVLENLDPVKRPAAATADFRELGQVESVTIQQDLSAAVQLLFDPDHSLEERILAEQFLS